MATVVAPQEPVEARIPPTPDGAARWIDGQRRRILHWVASRGPVRVEDIPRRWPLTRRHLGLLVDGLVEEGLLERVDTEGRAVRTSRRNP